MYTLVKTLPQYEPWVTFRLTYWKLLAFYVAISSLLDDDTNMETINKNLIRWEGTPEEVTNEMERTKQAASTRDMGPGDDYWIEMFNRIALHEYNRTREGRGSTHTPPSSAPTTEIIRLRYYYGSSLVTRLQGIEQGHGSAWGCVSR